MTDKKTIILRWVKLMNTNVLSCFIPWFEELPGCSAILILMLQFGLFYKRIDGADDT